MKSFLHTLSILVLLGFGGLVASSYPAVASLVTAFFFCWLLQMLLYVMLGRLISFLPLGPAATMLVMAPQGSLQAAGAASVAGHLLGIAWIWHRTRPERCALAPAPVTSAAELARCYVRGSCSKGR